MYVLSVTNFQNMFISHQKKSKEQMQYKGYIFLFCYRYVSI